MVPCRMMVDNPMQEDRLVVPSSEVRGERSERFVGGPCWQAWDGFCGFVQGSQAVLSCGPWPPAAVSGGHRAVRRGGMERSGRSAGQHPLRPYWRWDRRSGRSEGQYRLRLPTHQLSAISHHQPISSQQPASTSHRSTASANDKQRG